MANLRVPCTICQSKGRHRKLPSGEPCPNKNKGRGVKRKENPEDAMRRLREEACALPDAAFAAHARAIALEAKGRAKKIREAADAEAARVQAEANARLRDLALLTGGEEPEEPPEEPPERKDDGDEKPMGEEEALRLAKQAREREPAVVVAPVPSQRPEGVLANPTEGLTGAPGTCGALYPENVLVKCKQQTRDGKHLGHHYNPQQRKAWPQRRAS